jgi:antirestriction protein ArdC
MNLNPNSEIFNGRHLTDGPSLVGEVPAEALQRAQLLQPTNIDERITNQVLELLDAGVPPWTNPVVKGGLMMPNNPITGHQYGGTNTVLLWLTSKMRGYRSHGWVTKKWLFDQKKEEIRLKRLDGADPGRTGQRPCWVIYAGKREVTGMDEQGNEVKEKRPIYRYYDVFNLDQVEGPLADELRRKQAPERPPVRTIEEIKAQWMEPIHRYVQKLGVNVDHGYDYACYSVTRDMVCMPNPSDFQGGTDVERACLYYETLLHEIVHWSGAAHRLARVQKPHPDPAYAFEELVAELGAAFFGAKFNLPGIIRHASYIKFWRDVLLADKTAIRRAATQAMAAVNYCDGLVDDSVENAA